MQYYVLQCIKKVISQIKNHPITNKYVDTIIEEMKTDFFAATQEKIEVTNFWGHIHEKNMSTTLHNHDKAYVSAVVYLKIPEGSGKIVFIPRFGIF